MKARLFRLTAALMVVLSAPISFSVENLGIRNPIGSGPSTVPQSSISGGLVRTPDPIDTAGNLSAAVWCALPTQSIPQAIS
ncbi:MAG: hypothetical protein ACYTEK_22840 [Planctomycetota bacterium]|jgi:hypothetical protein